MTAANAKQLGLLTACGSWLCVVGTAHNTKQCTMRSIRHETLYPKKKGEPVTVTWQYMHTYTREIKNIAPVRRSSAETQYFRSGDDSPCTVCVVLRGNCSPPARGSSVNRLMSA